MREVTLLPRESISLSPSGAIPSNPAIQQLQSQAEEVGTAGILLFPNPRVRRWSSSPPTWW